MKMKFLSALLFVFLFTNTLFSEQAPDTTARYQIIDDSVHFRDGRVISFEQFYKESQFKDDSVRLLNGEVYSYEEYKKVLPNLIRKAREKEKNDRKQIIPSWKYYTLMLAFPVFLILLFVLVFIRGRKKR